MRFAGNFPGLNTHKQIYILSPPFQSSFAQRREDQLHMSFTIRQICIKPPPRKLRPHHPAPVRPYRSIGREQARQKHGLRRK